MPASSPRQYVSSGGPTQRRRSSRRGRGRLTFMPPPLLDSSIFFLGVMRFESLSSGCSPCPAIVGLVLGLFFLFSFFIFSCRTPDQCRARVRKNHRYLRRRVVACSSLFNFALPMLTSAQSRRAIRVPCSRVTWYSAICGPVCHLLYFPCCFFSTLIFRLNTSPLAGL